MGLVSDCTANRDAMSSCEEEAMICVTSLSTFYTCWWSVHSSSSAAVESAAKQQLKIKAWATHSIKQHMRLFSRHRAMNQRSQHSMCLTRHNSPCWARWVVKPPYTSLWYKGQHVYWRNNHNWADWVTEESSKILRFWKCPFHETSRYVHE